MAEDRKVVYEIEFNADGSVKEVQKLGQSIDKTEKNTKSFGKTLKGLGAAAGIFGLIATAITTMKEALENNQKVLDFFKTTTTALGIVVNDLFNFIIDNAGTVVSYFQDIFENPVESLKEFGDAIKANLIERFESFIDTLGFLGDTIQKIFEGDFAGALESAKKAGKEYVDIYTGVDGSFDKIVEGATKAGEAISNYTTEVINNSIAITESEKATQRLALEQQRLMLQFQKDAETQRQIRDDITLNINERIKANEKLGEILSEQIKTEQDAVNKQIAALRLQNQELGVTE